VDGAGITAAFDVVMRGDATPSQIAALLMGLRVRGETPEIVAAVVRAMRGAMVPLPARHPEELVDTCGTGGGGVATFNISTAAALVAAGAGARVAKHGNRSFTSRSGSADVLEALGVPIDRPVPVMRRALEEAGIVFMFAPLMHPAMRHVGPVRREIEIRAGQAAREWTIEAAAFGFSTATAADLAGGTPDENARVILDVLAGGGAPGARAAVLLNAGAALYVAGRAPTYEDAVALATRSLDAGEGMAALERLRRAFAP